jgi:hypothetical protein
MQDDSLGEGMSLWAIENLDDCGEGLFIVDAPSEEEAVRIHDEKEPQTIITSIEQIQWIDLALVTGELGESYYFKRQKERA